METYSRSAQNDSGSGAPTSVPKATRKILRITFRVVNMTESVRFYRDVLGIYFVSSWLDIKCYSLQSAKVDPS